MPGERLPENMVEAFNALPWQFQIDEATILRRVVSGDANRLIEIINANPDIPENVLWARQVKDGEQTVTQSLQRFSTESMVGRYVLERAGVVGGYIGIHLDTHRDQGEYEMGYFADPLLRGNDYVVKGAGTLIEAVRDTLSPVAIYLQAGVDNEASKHIATRLGFKAVEDDVWDEAMKAVERVYRLDLAT